MSKKFKTAKSLGLAEEHYCALVKALVELESGRIKHGPDASVGPGFGGGKVTSFNMGIWRSATQVRGTVCGTVCCIGGTAEVVSGLAMFTLSNVAEDRGEKSGLHRLFYPYELDDVIDDWDQITLPQATRALRNYLTTGKPKWREAVKE